MSFLLDCVVTWIDWELFSRLPPPFLISTPPLLSTSFSGQATVPIRASLCAHMDP